jgi:hypothetical protein
MKASTEYKYIPLTYPEMFLTSYSPSHLDPSKSKVKYTKPSFATRPKITPTPPTKIMGFPKNNPPLAKIKLGVK